MAAARDEQFDILLIYTLYRLSRHDSELPLLLSEMTECGVTVWSVQEGDMKYQTSTDRLLAYLYGLCVYLRAGINSLIFCRLSQRPVCLF